LDKASGSSALGSLTRSRTNQAASAVTQAALKPHRGGTNRGEAALVVRLA